MPRPLYIICAESLLLDRTTNLTTVVNVLEGIRFSLPGSRLPQEPRTLASQGFYGTAVRMRLDDDNPDQEYEFEIHMQFPGKEDQVAQSGKFKFTKRFHRFQLRVVIDARRPRRGQDFVCLKVASGRSVRQSG